MKGAFSLPPQQNLWMNAGCGVIFRRLGLAISRDRLWMPYSSGSPGQWHFRKRRPRWRRRAAHSQPRASPRYGGGSPIGPRHTILPGVVLRNGVPEFMMGCIGLNNHPQGQVQMLVNALDLGMNPQQAVDAARFRVVMTTDGACQMVRIHSGESGVGPCLESGVDHRLDGVALGS
jgi:hypothetical protein